MPIKADYPTGVNDLKRLAHHEFLRVSVEVLKASVPWPVPRRAFTGRTALPSLDNLADLAQYCKKIRIGQM